MFIVTFSRRCSPIHILSYSTTPLLLESNVRCTSQSFLKPPTENNPIPFQSTLHPQSTLLSTPANPKPHFFPNYPSLLPPYLPVNHTQPERLLKPTSEKYIFNLFMNHDLEPGKQLPVPTTYQPSFSNPWLLQNLHVTNYSQYYLKFHYSITWILYSIWNIELLL